MTVTGKNRNRLLQGVLLGCAVLFVPVAVPSHHPEVQAQSTINTLVAEDSDESTESTEPAQVSETIEPTESTDPTDSTEFTDSTELTASTELTDSTETTETTEPAASVVSVDPTTTVSTAASLNTTTTTTTSVASTPLAAAAITAAVAPSAPRSFRVGGVGNGRVSLAWMAPVTGPPSSGYFLTYAPAGGTWRTISLGGRTSWTLTGLRNGTRYYLYLYAANGSARSPAATATAVLPSGTPRSFRVSGVGNGRVSLAWSAPVAGPPSSGYFLTYAPAGGTWRTISLGGRTSWTLTGLRNGTRYYLYLYAANGSARSPAATATAVLPSGTPRNYRVSGVGNGRVSLAWSAPVAGPPSSGYFLTYAPAGGTWRTISLGGRTSWTLTGLRNGTRYYLNLYAVHNGYRSPIVKTWATTGGSSAVPPVTPGNCPAAPNMPGGADPWGGCWPGVHNTGVPSGTALTPHTGSCELSSGTYTARVFNCDVTIVGPVTITRSRVNGYIRVRAAPGHLTIADSEVIASPPGVLRQVTAINTVNGGGATIVRVETTGGRQGVFCKGCTIRDSYLHGIEIEGTDWHAQAVWAEQDATLVHNTLWCDPPKSSAGGGCTANQAGFPDFMPSMNWHIERNLYMSGNGLSFCAYGGDTDDKAFSDHPDNATNIVYDSNVFRRDTINNRGAPDCSRFGPINDFDPNGAGNSWVNNRWHTGEMIPIPN